MTCGKSGIVLKHENLKLNKLLDEAPPPGRLRLDVNRSIPEVIAGAIGDDVVDVPAGSLVRGVFVSIHFLLAICPLRERGWMGPEQVFGVHMDELEVPGQRLPRLSLVRVNHLNLKEGVIMSFFGFD